MKPCFGFMRRWFQLFFVDHRGCGFSDPCPSRTLDLRNNFEDLETLRQSFGFEKINVLGTSYGGMVASAYAARYPKNIDLLFLIGTAGSGDFIRAAREYLAQHGTPKQIRVADRLWKGTFQTQVQFRHFSRIFDRLYVRRRTGSSWTKSKPLVDFNLDALNHGFRDVLPSWSVLKELRKVRAPTFIGVGKHDWICPVSQSEALAEALPHAVFKIYTHSAHSPYCEEPRSFQKDIALFLKNVGRLCEAASDSPPTRRVGLLAIAIIV